MSEYDNNNSGALFKNDKQGNEKRPDYKGSAEVDGRQYWVSAWIKQSKSGQTFMSLRYEPKEAQAGSAPAPAATPAVDDDNIPF